MTAPICDMNAVRCSIFTGKQSCKWGEQRAFQWVGGDLDKPQTFLSRCAVESVATLLN